METTDHTLTMSETSYFSAPLVWVARCGCGYSSGKQATERAALQAWTDHKEAKSQ